MYISITAGEKPLEPRIKIWGVKAEDETLLTMISGLLADTHRLVVLEDKGAVSSWERKYTSLIIGLKAKRRRKGAK